MPNITPFRLNSLLVRLLIGLGIPLILFVAVGIVGVMMNFCLVTGVLRVKHSQDVIVHATSLDNLVEGLRLEIHRGVIADGGQLSPEFRRRIEKFLDDSRTLQELVRDNRDQMDRLSDVRKALMEWTDL